MMWQADVKDYHQGVVGRMDLNDGVLSHHTNEETVVSKETDDANELAIISKSIIIY